MMQSLPKIKVLVVDDHPVVRDGLTGMLLAFDDLDPLGAAENGQAALAFCRQNAPDVILMDLLMPGMDGIQATGAILKEFPKVKVVVLTSSTEDDRVQEALAGGATGYLLKNASIDELAQAVRLAYAGRPSLAPEAAAALIRMKAGAPRPGYDLSPREREVLALVVEGLSNEEIAARLVISPATARHHVSACIEKLGAANRTQAAALAVKHKLVP